MKKILLLLVVCLALEMTCFAIGGKKCNKENPYCVELIYFLNPTEETFSNYSIQDKKSLSEDYDAVILYNTVKDNYAIFVVNKKKMEHYITLDILPSPREHDYNYWITAATEKYIDIDGRGNDYGDQQQKLRYYFNLETKALKYKYPRNNLSLNKMVKFNKEIFFSGGSDSKSSIIFRLKSALPEAGKYDYEIITEIQGEKIDPISDIENRDGKLYFISKDKTYTFTKSKGFRTVLNPKEPKIWVYENLIRVRKENEEYSSFLRQPSYKLFEKYRPERVKNGYTKGRAKFENKIGPWVKFDSKIWFGLKFYDGEGITGVGGYGVFDINSISSVIKYYQETAAWSASAIFVDYDKVCLG
ncbi:MAG: hypothetical protein J7L03_05050, partial [Caldisericaceae bacterium]|nr:hypothetical protein [Caldisericaceae bacterium]